jgi:F-type H+-transporting ATPase subunit c
MDIQMISALAAALGLGIAAAGAAVGQGYAVGKAVEGISRQPEARGMIMSTLIIGIAFIESLALYALLISIILLFVNPFIK